MSSPDIRAGVALLIAALSAEGKAIQNIGQIDGDTGRLMKDCVCRSRILSENNSPVIIHVIIPVIFFTLTPIVYLFLPHGSNENSEKVNA
jgi:hypothetical protein